MSGEEIFQKFKEAFPGFPHQSLERFIGYCELHSQTQLALFHVKDRVLLSFLTGEKSMDEFPVLKKMIEEKQYAEEYKSYPYSLIKKDLDRIAEIA
jgi:hypothetical protein